MTENPAMAGLIAGSAETTLVIAGSDWSPGYSPRSTEMPPCGRTLVLQLTAEASTGMPQFPPMAKVVAMLVGKGLLELRESKTRQGVTV
ncbi:MAG TPA: hypothetical protein VOA80_17430 [Thermoanaerobaculia bacterium]|nr:hypothetical protein [Thermoanaerobaculia bacterium]